MILNHIMWHFVTMTCDVTLTLILNPKIENKLNIKLKRERKIKNFKFTVFDSDNLNSIVI